MLKYLRSSKWEKNSSVILHNSVLTNYVQKQYEILVFRGSITLKVFYKS